VFQYLLNNVFVVAHVLIFVSCCGLALLLLLLLCLLLLALVELFPRGNVLRRRLGTICEFN